MGIRMTGHSMRRSKRETKRMKVNCPQCEKELEVVETTWKLPAACDVCRIVFNIETGEVIRKFQGDGKVV